MTTCSCGKEHKFHNAKNAPETIDCDDCPVCSGDSKENDDFRKYDFTKEWYEQVNEEELDKEFYKDKKIPEDLDLDVNDEDDDDDDEEADELRY